MQGIPLALRLGRCFLLQLSQPPPLLLYHLLPCRRDRWESQWVSNPSRRGDTGIATNHHRQREEASRDRLTQGSPLPAPASLKPRQLQTSNPARLQLPAQLATAHSLASAFFLHPEPTQGTKPVQVVPWQLDGQLAPAHNQGLNR